MKKLKLVFLSLSLLIAVNGASQNYYFPKELIKDSVKLEKQLQQISASVIKNLKPDSSVRYYADLFNLQMIVLDYGQAQKSINSYIERYAIDRLLEGRVFNYKVYVAAKQYQNVNNVSFIKACKICFSEMYDRLPEYLLPEVELGYNNIISNAELKELFVKQLKKAKYSDSLTVNEFKRICRAYNKFKVYSEAGEIGQKMLRKKDSELFEIDKDIQIKTPEGGNVSALVIRKKGVKKPLPAIFIYNIYAGSYDYVVAKRAALYGYVGVAVNTRGKRSSDNDINPFEYDGRDSYSIIDWISKHSWCNGKVGMMGGSYLGFSQWASVKKKHPALKTIVPQVSVGIGIDYPMHNNVFMSYMLRWINYVKNNRYTDPLVFRDSEKWENLYEKWYMQGVPFRKLDSLNEQSSETFQKWLDHPGYDEYWQNMVPYKEEFAKIEIPILTTTGYFDDDQVGALYYFNEHYKWNPGANHYLVIGPYSHSGGQHYPARTLRKYKIDETANMSIHKLAYEWFDYVLKGKQKPALLKDKINYQVMNTNRWEHTPSFSDMNKDTLVFYLNSVTDGSCYQLSKDKAIDIEYIKHEIDLSRRDKDESIDYSTQDLILDEIDKKHQLCFLSEELEKTITVNGSFSGELSVSINKKDMDITIRLYELLPNGKYFFLSDFMGRASYAKNNSNRELLVPNVKHTIPFKRSFMTSKKIEKGSRLVVVLGIIKSKYWQVNYGTGKDVSEETIKDAGAPLLIKWYGDSFIKIGFNDEKETTIIK